MYFRENIIPHRIAKMVGGCLVLLVILSPTIFSVGLFLLLALIHRFYRNPKRECPGKEGVVYSMCDGVVKKIEHSEFSTSILVYMDLRDCHVQRVPISGSVIAVSHKPGSHLWAWHDKMAGFNEQNSTHIHSKYGFVTVKQIAGKFARRIECWVARSETVTSGQLLGMIHFSSACEIRLPAAANIVIKEGDRVYAGITPIAVFPIPSDTELLNAA
jgi:phosphatidylserine decarboxylase